MTEATVSIAEVTPQAVRIARTDLKVGDRVFTVWGGRTYAVTKVRHFKHVTHAKREDGEVFVLEGDQTITVIPGEAR